MPAKKRRTVAAVRGGRGGRGAARTQSHSMSVAESKDESVAESQGSLTNSGSRSRHSSASSSSSNDVIPSSQSTNRTAQSAEERPFHEDESLTQSSQKKKRIRMSKKEIPLYEWSDEMIKKVADFVKDHEQLFDKRHREWLNKKTKTQLWTRIGSTLEPCATGDQCKKLYENMRTRVGKILNKNKKSGSGANEVTPKDAEIMETWDFLGSHIVRGKTNPSEDFGSQVDLAEEQEADDLSTTGSATGSVVRAPRSTAASSVISASAISQRDLSDDVHELLCKADTIGKTVQLMGNNKSVHDFACLLEGHMQSIPEDNWHGFELACLTLVQQYRHAKQQQQPPPHPFEYTGVNQWSRSADYMGSLSQGAPEWSQTGGSGAPRWSAGSQYSIPLAGGYQSQYQASSVTSTPRSSGQVFMAPATPVRSPQPVFTTPSCMNAGSSDNSMMQLSPVRSTLSTPPVTMVSPSCSGLSSDLMLSMLSNTGRTDDDAEQ